MTDSLIAISLNAVFLTGISAIIGRHGGRERIDRVFATTVVAFATIVVSLELLGLAGQINRVTVAALCLVTGLVGIWRWFHSSHDDVPGGTLSRPFRLAALRWSSAPAIVAAALAVWAALLYLLLGLLLPVEPISDAPIYHLPFAVRWWKTGSLALVPTPFGEEAATYFPANGNLWLAWLLATGATPLVKVGQWPFVILGATALYGLGRRGHADWPAALLPAALWATFPVILIQSSIADVDLIWTAFYFVAVYFLLEWIDDPHAEADAPIVFFALSSGIVIGSKAVGAVFVTLLLPLAVFALATGVRPLRRLAWLTSGLLLPSLYWYARNVWLTGNAVYPLQLSIFGRVLADGWYVKSAMEATAYHITATLWQVLFARLHLVLGITGLALVVVGVIAGWLHALGRSEDRTSRRAVGTYSTLAFAQVVIYWWLLPYNTQERFLSPAFGLALVPVAIIMTRRPLLQTGVALLVAWQLFERRDRQISDFTLLRVYDNPLSPDSWLTWVLPLSIVAAVTALIWAPRARWMIAAASVAAGCVFVARPASVYVAEHPLQSFYPQTGFAASLFPAWEILEGAAKPSGSRVAYAGTNLPYYLLGTGLQNEVRYININNRPDWLPHDYHQERVRTGRFELAGNPWPQWYRSEADFNSWVENLRRRRIEYLFIARENTHGRLETGAGELPRFPIERTWADQHPELFADLGPFQYPAGTIPWARVYRVLDGP